MKYKPNDTHEWVRNGDFSIKCQKCRASRCYCTSCQKSSFGAGELLQLNGEVLRDNDGNPIYNKNCSEINLMQLLK